MRLNTHRHFRLFLVLIAIGACLLISCSEDKPDSDDSSADLNAPDPARDLDATAGADFVIFEWENVDEEDEDGNEVPKRNEDYKGSLVLRSTEGRPVDLPYRKDKYEAGDTLGDSTVVYSEDDETFTDEGLEPGTTYYYAFFSYDEVPNYGNPTFLEATPGSSIKSRISHTMTALDNGDILVTGGVGFDGPHRSLELYDADPGAFEDLEAIFRTERWEHSAVKLADGRVLITGGYEEGFQDSQRTGTIFNPATLRTEALQNQMQSGRSQHTSTLLPDGRVLITGGTDGDQILATAEIFDPETGAFVQLENPMIQKRSDHTATGFVFGESFKVLIAGGYDGSQAVQTATLFDPSTEQFTDLSGDSGAETDMAVSRLSHSATLIGEGDENLILLCGGFSGNSVTGQPTDSCEIFVPDETGGALEDGPALLEARSGHASTLLDDGSLLILGGITGDLEVLSSAELLEVETDTFTAVGSMVRERTVPQAALMADGRVMVTGGNGSGDVFDTMPVSSAEVFSLDTQSFSILSSQ